MPRQVKLEMSFSDDDGLIKRIDTKGRNDFITGRPCIKVFRGFAIHHQGLLRIEQPAIYEATTMIKLSTLAGYDFR